MLSTLFALATGLAAAGCAGSAWVLLAGEPPGRTIGSARLASRLASVPACVLHAPLTLLRIGGALAASGRPAGIALIAAGALWCFLQGVFILAYIFGL